MYYNFSEMLRMEMAFAKCVCIEYKQTARKLLHRIECKLTNRDLNPTTQLIRLFHSLRFPSVCVCVCK